MMAIDLRDAMRVELTQDPAVSLTCRWLPSRRVWDFRLGGSTKVSCLDLPQPTENLVHRALVMFQQEFFIAQGFRVQLDKRIPAGAGMGGASSDASSALLCAATLCNVSSDDDRLLTIAAKLGSDVPFFMARPSRAIGRVSTAGSQAFAAPGQRSLARGLLARGRGRGEQLECYTANSRLHFVVVYPPEALSTARVFQHCVPAAAPRDASGCCRVLTERSPRELPGHLYNRLAEPARKLSQWIDKTLEAIRLTGLQGVTMTGSGSACFGLAPSARVARRMANRLSARGVGICFAATSDRLPPPIRFLT